MATKAKTRMSGDISAFDTRMDEIDQKSNKKAAIAAARFVKVLNNDGELKLDLVFNYEPVPHEYILTCAQVFQDDDGRYVLRAYCSDDSEGSQIRSYMKTCLYMTPDSEIYGDLLKLRSQRDAAVRVQKK
jgi:hypothetical protein